MDEKKLGINSPLHIIIFDEIDAICRQRGSLVRGGVGFSLAINCIIDSSLPRVVALVSMILW